MAAAGEAWSEPPTVLGRYHGVMPPHQTSKPELTLSSGAGAPMSAEQTAVLKQLALDAFEPDAFGAHLTRTEADRRIIMLKAKLTLLDEPPHTL
jgi:hypothetical protein